MLPYFYIYGIKFNTFPIIIFFAIIVCTIYFTVSKNYNKFYYVSVLRMCFPMFVFAAIGARITSAITMLPTSEHSFFYNLVYGGSVFYGGLIGATLGLYITCKLKHLEFFDYSDVYVTILPLGQAIGRIGCFFNGCCYGKVYYGLFAISYPVNGQMVKVFPTWFIEATFCFCLFLYFQFVYSGKKSGIRTAIYLIAYSIYRFIIEYFRGDEIRGVIGGLSSSQYLSVLLLITGLIILSRSRKNNMPNYFFEREHCNYEF